VSYSPRRQKFFWGGVIVLETKKRGAAAVMKRAHFSVLVLVLCWRTLLAHDQKAIVPLGEALVHPAEVHGIALSPDGKWAATGAADNKLRLWDSATGKLHGEPLEHPGAVYPVAFSPDSTLVVGG